VPAAVNDQESLETLYLVDVVDERGITH